MLRSIQHGRRSGVGEKKREEEDLLRSIAYRRQRTSEEERKRRKYSIIASDTELPYVDRAQLYSQQRQNLFAATNALVNVCATKLEQYCANCGREDLNQEVMASKHHHTHAAED